MAASKVKFPQEHQDASLRLRYRHLASTLSICSAASFLMCIALGSGSLSMFLWALGLLSLGPVPFCVLKATVKAPVCFSNWQACVLFICSGVFAIIVGIWGFMAFLIWLGVWP